jgi:hypothetical protein
LSTTACRVAKKKHTRSSIPLSLSHTPIPTPTPTKNNDDDHHQQQNPQLHLSGAQCSLLTGQPDAAGIDAFDWETVVERLALPPAAVGVVGVECVE